MQVFSHKLSHVVSIQPSILLLLLRRMVQLQDREHVELSQATVLALMIKQCSPATLRLCNMSHREDR